MSLHDQSPLKAIKHCKLDKSEEKGGGARDERKDSSASVFEVANANGLNDLTAGGEVNSSLQLFADRERKVLFLLDIAF